MTGRKAARARTATAHQIRPDDRLALLMHGHLSGGYGKMGLGLLRYSEASIACVVDRCNAGRDLAALTGITRDTVIVASVSDAVRLGANVLVLGVATPGGVLPEDWRGEIKVGLEAGMSLVNGLHARMRDDEPFSSLLHRGRFIWDIRREPENLHPGMGLARTVRARRVVTVGTDMACGKMTAALEMDRAARRLGIRSAFLASGQIGICISGDGIAVDSVRVDFATGAVEDLVVQYGREHDVLFIEGQGCLLHPASTAWLALLRGACPTHMILAHRAGQETLARVPWARIPPLEKVVALYEAVCAAAGALPAAPVAGIALNTAGLDEDTARAAVRDAARDTGLPATDPVRFGAETLVRAVCEGDVA